jgi:hypothetical protein
MSQWLNLAYQYWIRASLCGRWLEKRLSPGSFGSVKSAASWSGFVLMGRPAGRGRRICRKIGVFPVVRLRGCGLPFNAWFTNPGSRAPHGAPLPGSGPRAGLDRPVILMRTASGHRAALARGSVASACARECEVGQGVIGRSGARTALAYLLSPPPIISAVPA